MPSVFPEGEVLHDLVGGGAVPVFFAGRAGHCLAGVGLDDGAVPGADEGDAGEDVRVWPRTWECQLVRAPGAKRTWLRRAREGSWPA